MGKPLRDKLRKQFSIYIPFIPKTFNRTSPMGKGNHKLNHKSSSPFFLGLGIAFLMQSFPFLSPRMIPWRPCLLAWICLVDSNSPIKIEGYFLSPEVSYVGRKWIWDIGDNDSGFQQFPIPYFIM